MIDMPKTPIQKYLIYMYEEDLALNNLQRLILFICSVAYQPF